MPNVKPQESRGAFLQRCIPMLIKEGKTQEQAVAICNSMYNQTLDSNARGIGTVFTSNIHHETILSV